MKMVLISLVLGFATNLANAETLSFANNSLQAEATWQHGPVVMDESILKIEWKTTSNNNLIDPESFEVVLDMPAMNHGSDDTVIKKLSIGVYEVSNIYFVMGGDWDVNVIVTFKDGSKETQAIKVHFEGGGHHH